MKPFVQVEKEALTTIFSLPENGSSSIVKTETVDYSMHSYDDIAVPESDGDHNAFRKVGIDASPCGPLFASLPSSFSSTSLSSHNALS